MEKKHIKVPLTDMEKKFIRDVRNRIDPDISFAEFYSKAIILGTTIIKRESSIPQEHINMWDFIEAITNKIEEENKKHTMTRIKCKHCGKDIYSAAFYKIENSKKMFFCSDACRGLSSIK